MGFNRYANEYSASHTTMGNDRYYTFERYASNQLPHRRQNTENIVAQLQLYIPNIINPIIDSYLANVEKEDENWGIALLRMDLRNTVQEVDKEAVVIIFHPKPFPEDQQNSLDSRLQERQNDTSAISIYLWASKVIEGSSELPPSYEQLVDHFKKMVTLVYDEDVVIDPRVTMAAIGVILYRDKLNEEQCKYCTKY